MRVIWYAEVECDDCGKVLRRMAPPLLPTGMFGHRRILRDLGLLADKKGWRMEGQPWTWAGDLCAACWKNEKELMTNER